MNKGLILLPIFFLSVNACQKSDPYVKFLKDYSIPKICSTILDDYWKYHRDEIPQMLEKDLDYCRKNYSWYCEHIQSVIDEENGIQKDKLKIAFLGGKYGDAYLVYVYYDTFYEAYNVWNTLPACEQYVYKNDEIELNFNFSEGYLSHEMSVYQNHEFYSLTEAFDKGILTKENTLYLQKVSSPWGFASFHDVLMSDIDHSVPNHAKSSMKKGYEKLIATYLNNNQIFDTKVYEKDIDINYSLGFCWESKISKTSKDYFDISGKIFYINIPKLKIEHGVGETVVKVNENFSFVNYSRLEPLLYCFHSKDKTRKIMTFKELYEEYNITPVNPPEFYEQYSYLLKNHYLGNWGYLSNFYDYLEK